MEYSRGHSEFQAISEEAPTMHILVADVLDLECGRAEVVMTTSSRDAAAFPDPGRTRRDKKFAVRFEVSCMPCTYGK